MLSASQHTDLEIVIGKTARAENPVILNEVKYLFNSKILFIQIPHYVSG